MALLNTDEPADLEKGSHRITVTIPSHHYELLQRMANEGKVSVSWVVRDAVEHYLKQRWPLLDEADNS